MCVFQEINGEEVNCPARALTRRYLHIRQHTSNTKEVLSAYWDHDGLCRAVTAEHIATALKLAAARLDYPSKKGIPLHRINTHSLRSGGANALSLSGYSDTEIQKMGRWRGATFKEYIREELACFLKNMSRSMKTKFRFVNISGNAFYDVTSDVVLSDYFEASANATSA